MEMDYKDKILALSVISTKYNQGINLFESFAPVVEHVLYLYKKDTITLLQIQKQIEVNFSLIIPLQTIRTLASYLRKKNKLKWEKSLYIINREKLEVYQYDNDNINELSECMVVFFRDRGIEISKEKAIEILCLFIYKNREQFLSFFQYTNSSRFNSDVLYYDEILEFINYIQLERIQEYDTLRSIYMGAMVASLFELENSTFKTINRKTNMFSSVVLDSNFLFKLFDFQTDLDFKIANETMKLLKDSNINISVLSITIDEIKSSLLRFVSFVNRNKHIISTLPIDLKINGLLAAYIRRSLNINYFIDFAHDLEDYIKNKGIQIINFDIDEVCLNNEDILILEDLKKRNDSSDNTLYERVIHDIKLIEYIKSVRKRKIYEFFKM